MISTFPAPPCGRHMPRAAVANFGYEGGLQGKAAWILTQTESGLYRVVEDNIGTYGDFIRACRIQGIYPNSGEPNRENHGKLHWKLGCI